MMTRFFIKVLRRWLAGAEQSFVFSSVAGMDIGPLEKTDLYIHIPFCRNSCPYCPYNRTDYDPALTAPYAEALMREIDLYRSAIGPAVIGSVYVGGGTPTTMIKELSVILGHLRKNFRVSGPVCLETSPDDLCPENIRSLKDCGVSLLSVGVQTFNDGLLKILGRTYRGRDIFAALERVMAAGFDCVNADMMFVLPGQSMKDLEADLVALSGSGVQQCTLYPLFTFPYASVGRQMKLSRLRMPSFAVRRQMYSRIHGFFMDKGYDRVSVWGFRKGNVPRYSSVTRDNYIGIGAGAGSKQNGSFYLNTFSVREYIETVRQGELPVALNMAMTARTDKLYRLYWRLYETYIRREAIVEAFGNGGKISALLALGRLAGLYKEKNGLIELTERGSFYIHLAQNHFVLNYIDKVWSRCMKEAWPDRIEI